MIFSGDEIDNVQLEFFSGDISAAENDQKPCRQTKDCSDSGTVCQLGSSASSDSTTEPPSDPSNDSPESDSASSAESDGDDDSYNPSTEEEYEADGMQSPYGDFSPRNPDADISADLETDSTKLTPGGTIYLNKHTCKIISIAPNPSVPPTTDSSSVTAATTAKPGDRDSNTNSSETNGDLSNIDLSDAMPELEDTLKKSYKNGEIVKTSKFKCKIVKLPQESKPVTEEPGTAKPRRPPGVCKCDAAKRFVSIQ